MITSPSPATPRGCVGPPPLHARPLYNTSTVSHLSPCTRPLPFLSDAAHENRCEIEKQVCLQMQSTDLAGSPWTPGTGTAGLQCRHPRLLLSPLSHLLPSASPGPPFLLFCLLLFGLALVFLSSACGSLHPLFIAILVREKASVRPTASAGGREGLSSPRGLPHLSGEEGPGLRPGRILTS